MSQPKHFLSINGNLFDLEQSTIYGIFESYGKMTWHIEIYPFDEENYIMFNALVFDNIFSPSQLNNLKFDKNDRNDDLYGHTVSVEAEDRFMKSVKMNFGIWDAENQAITLTGEGLILKDDNLPEVPFKFNVLLQFTGLYLFETSAKETYDFVDYHFSAIKEKLNIKFEDVPSGLQAFIDGKF